MQELFPQWLLPIASAEKQKILSVDKTRGRGTVV